MNVGEVKKVLVLLDCLTSDENERQRKIYEINLK